METQASKFGKVLSQFCEFLASVVEDINASTSTDKINTDSLDILAEYVKSEGADVLMSTFIKGHIHWERLYKKDYVFITNDIPKIYDDGLIDTSVITKPVSMYLHSRNTGDQCLISEEDIGYMWDYFTAMTKISILHTEMVRASDKSFEAELNVEKYKKMFSM